MTREEAIKIFSEKKVGKDWEADWIDKLAALGVLKLEPPPSLDARINTALNMEILYPAGDRCAGGIKKALDKAGFKIVEK